MALARVTVTVPARLLKEADRRASALQRSRSWVVAEALRGFLAGAVRDDAGRGARAPALVREDAPAPYAAPAADVERARLRHLEAELALTPAARLERAEELGRLARSRQRRGRRHQVIGFESWDDYDLWKTAQRIGG
ncbi:MAG: hypothetical protein Q8Q85_05240 [Gemmatimonadales bacterium]|nr:hypothetical protein [Gemmatimonadales bacterium]